MFKLTCKLRKVKVVHYLYIDDLYATISFIILSLCNDLLYVNFRASVNFEELSCHECLQQILIKGPYKQTNM